MTSGLLTSLATRFVANFGTEMLLSSLYVATLCASNSWKCFMCIHRELLISFQFLIKK